MTGGPWSAGLGVCGMRCLRSWDHPPRRFQVLPVLPLHLAAGPDEITASAKPARPAGSPTGRSADPFPTCESFRKHSRRKGHEKNKRGWDVLDKLVGFLFDGWMAEPWCVVRQAHHEGGGGLQGVTSCNVCDWHCNQITSLMVSLSNHALSSCGPEGSEDPHYSCRTVARGSPFLGRIANF